MAIHTTIPVPITPATPTDDRATSSCHNAIDGSDFAVQAARVGRTVARDRLFRHSRRRFISNAAAEAARTSRSDCDNSNDSSYALKQDDSKSNFDEYDDDSDGWLSDTSDRDSSSCRTNFSNNNNPMEIENDDVMHIDDAEDTKNVSKRLTQMISIDLLESNILGHRC